MARDIKVQIAGNARVAEAALKELQRTGNHVASSLERDFNQLGTKSNLVFDAKRDAAKNAYGKIKSSGIATADELARAERGLADNLKRIDEDQYGKRLTLAEKFQKNRTAIMAGAAATAYAAFRIGKEAVEEYKEFQTALTDLGKVTNQSLGEIRASIMAMPAELGSATELVEGYYQVISAGVTEPKAALDLLTVAAKASKAAHVEQGETIQALTKLMAGYSGSIKNATAASDLLFGIEKLGQTTFSELVPVIGDLAAISHQVSVSQYEMGAALSQITQTAGSTSQAATQYRAILVGLLKPQKNMQAALDAMGFSSGKAAIEALGLSGVLQGLEGYAYDSGLSMGKLFESSEALTALGPLLASQFAGYNTALVELQGNAGATDRAFQEWSGTLQATEDMFRNTVGKVMIELGEQLAPMVQDALKGLATWMTDNKQGIVDFFTGVATVVKLTVSAVELLVDAWRKVVDALAEVSVEWERSPLRGGAAALNFIMNPGGAIAQQFAKSITSPASPSGSSGSVTIPAPPRPSVYSTQIDPTTGGYYYNDTGYAVGTSYVPRTGHYQLHRGEQVLNRQEAKQGQGGQAQGSNMSFGDINLSFPNITDKSTSRELARDLYPQLKALGMRFA